MFNKKPWLALLTRTLMNVLRVSQSFDVYNSQLTWSVPVSAASCEGTEFPGAVTAPGGSGLWSTIIDSQLQKTPEEGDLQTNNIVSSVKTRQHWLAVDHIFMAIDLCLGQTIQRTAWQRKNYQHQEHYYIESHLLFWKKVGKLKWLYSQRENQMY